MPTLGVVIPAFNAAPWLATAVASLHAQTRSDWRCVIVDDGSRDTTGEIAESLATADHRVTVLSQPNAGVSAARNAGTALLPPDVELVTYLDADDVLLPGAHAELVAALAARPDAVGAYGLAEYLDADGAPIQPGEQPRRQRDRRTVVGRRLATVPPAADATFEELAVNGPIVPPAVAVIRRSVLDAVGGWDATLVPQEDWHLYLRMSRLGPFVALDRQVAWYRRHDSNATGQLATLRRVQAELRHRMWRDPTNTPAQRRSIARAWRYLRLRDAVLLVRQARGAGRQHPAGSVTALRGAGLALLQAALPGPPAARWSWPDLTTPAAGAAPVSIMRGRRRPVHRQAVEPSSAPTAILCITVVVTDLADTGATRVTLERAARWSAAGDEVTVFCVLRTPAGAPRAPVPVGLRIQYATRRPRKLRAALPLALRAVASVARRSDVLVAGTEVGFGLLVAAAAGRLTRRAVSVTIQSNLGRAIDAYVDRRLQPVTRAVLRRVDLAVCVASGLIPTVTAVGVDPSRIAVARNAVSRDVVRALAAAVASPTARLPYLVGTGRLSHQKGFDSLIQAHALALQEGAPPHAVIILGEGEERSGLERLAEELGVAATVSLPGFAANPHPVVAAAALFVLPSRWEGFSLSLAEALALGVPCVAFDCVAGPREILDGDRFGRLVPAGDVGALAAAIADHLTEPGPLRERAKLAASSPLEIFDVDRPAQQHRDVQVGSSHVVP